MAYERKGITVWNLPENPAEVIAAGQVAGAEWIEFKVHDGGSDQPSTQHRAA